MKQNCIKDNEVLIFDGQLSRNPGNAGTHILILIMDEYVKSKNYQKLMRENRCFYIGRDLLYRLLTEFLGYVTHLFERIRLDDLNLNEGNKTLLFLKKFASSSEIIKTKIDRLNTLKAPEQAELFTLHIAGLENTIDFTRNQDGNSRLSLEIPVGFLYNRLISYIDKMEFTDLNTIDSEVRKQFMKQFNDLNQRILDQKQQIEIKYALELSQERARDLEEQNSKLQDKLNQLRFQNDLYKRSYFSLKKRYNAFIAGKMETNGTDDENLEEL